ncbi:hypothetical protein ACNHYB_12930 [Isoptericola jiangsuensis]|uniref:hypothetical protein n=1 Tax=Isoptericola jiangsuensis TaxID=548579 RepID=UPI003AAA81D9
MFEGAEHDGAFVDGTSISVYEFTTLRSKAKAEKDVRKIARLVKHLESQPDNRFKSATGYFVTRDEPTAEQRSVAVNISKQSGVTIRALSFIVLQKLLVDIESYIRLRQNAPFGSASTHLADSEYPNTSSTDYVEPEFQGGVNEILRLNDLVDLIESSSRVAVTGDYGIGKSAAFRELFFRLRKRYFRAPDERCFPVHINLRDCIGLKTPNEILRRHAEEIGFEGASGLVSAWRAGRVHLLLDGFDELVPTRWVGSVKNLRQVRWNALAAARKLIEQTPLEAGVAVSGRNQYFGDHEELSKCLAIDENQIFRLADFDDARARQLAQGVQLPEWLPTRPLAIAFFRESTRSESAVSGIPQSRGAVTGWRDLIRMVATREAQRVDSIDESTFVELLARIAVYGRIESGGERISISNMSRAFVEVCGYEPEEEGIQALLRLPGLAAPPTYNGTEDVRFFVDRDLADAAFGLGMADYAQAPYSDHPLGEDAGWPTISGTLVWETCSDELTAKGFSPAIVTGAIKQRMDGGKYDAVLADLIGIADAMGMTAPKAPSSVTGVIAERISVSEEASTLAGTTWTSCVIETLDVADHGGVGDFPHLVDTLIGSIEGWAQIPPALASHFSNCEIGAFSPGGSNVSEIKALELTGVQRVALTVLRKVFMQAGSARKFSALRRGLPPELRDLVPAAVDVLVSRSFVEIVDGKAEKLVHGVRSARSQAMALLNAPAGIREIVPD